MARRKRKTSRKVNSVLKPGSKPGEVSLANCTHFLDPELKSETHLYQCSIPIAYETDSSNYRFTSFGISPSGKIHREHTLTGNLHLFYGMGSEQCCVLYWKNAILNKIPKDAACFAFYDLPFEVCEALRNKKHFSLVWSSTTDSGIMEIEVYLNKGIVLNLDHASDVIHGGVNMDVQTVVSFFTGVFVEEYQDIPVCEEELVKTIYNSVENKYNMDNDAKQAGHHFLIPKLRDYQKQAVRWMLQRELKKEPKFNAKKDLHPLYIKLRLYDRELFYNRFCGIFSENYYRRPPAIRGGVLADEMGLGKTVEVLACILLNPMIEDLRARGNNFTDYRETACTSGSNTLSRQKTCATTNGKRCSQEIPSTSAKRKQTDHPQCFRLKKGIETFPEGVEFECVCGTYYSKKSTTSVACKNCKLMQHTACVLNDPMEICDPYICPYCWVNEEPIVSRATLIVSPASIIYQWEEEIQKHVRENTLKVFMYHGVQHDKFLQPPILADNDIVLIAYETLRKEINYVNVTRNNDDSNRNLRHPKKFASIPTPLTKIHWWRICLDEAQMVESVTTKTSAMTLQLLAVNRWCVTGTPIQKSVEDLYGLLLFLGYDPFYEKFWWKELILKPAANANINLLKYVINDVMWRTTKNDVLEQIGIPPQNILTHMLDFSAVEKAFYDQHHRQCRHEFFLKIEQYDCSDAKLNSLNHNVVCSLLQPFRKLRQACCHPQLVRGEFSVTKSTITMPQLLENMIKKAKNACEESQRQHIASLNGLAGMYMIQDEFFKAIETYEKVLETVQSNIQFFRADRLQLFHTTFNLAQILRRIYCPESENNEHSRIEVDENTQIHIDYMNKLQVKADEMYAVYISKHFSLVTNAKENLDIATNQVEEIQAQFKFSKTSPWWNQIISYCSSIEENFCDRVKYELNRCDYGSAAYRFNDCAGLKYLITGHLNYLDQRNENVKRLVGQLSLTPTAPEVNEASCCHLRPLGRLRVKCVYCSVDSELGQYERTLFRFNDITTDERRMGFQSARQIYNNSLSNGEAELQVHDNVVGGSNNENGVFNTQRHGTWADSELEIILKCLLSVAKSSPALKCCVEEGINHVKWFDSLKKEFKCLRSLWMRIVDFASCIDETEMGKLQMRLQEPNEAAPNSNNPNVIHPTEVDSTLMRFQLEAMQYQTELKTKMGHMFYLENLRKSDESTPISSQLCPVCRSKFGHIWSVLSCCHSVCEVCIQELLMNYSVGRVTPAIQCPECRMFTIHTDIKHVHSTRDEMSVKGSWSTKVTGIINCLNQIADEDSTAKTLVFCNWANFIGVLEQSLELNEIPFISLGNKKNFHENLEKFKHDPDINVLLLQYNAGANGLNIIEASHIILVEPSLEYSVVQQAIGRIHRIGQNKETTVHQFVVRETIEEKIFEFERPFLFAEREILHESSLSVRNIMDLFEEM